jgi:ABC-type uncharacterized transport system involved in gliding motility auxiliary subunit
MNSGIGLVLLAIGFLVFTVLNNQLFSGFRLDLTEGKLYTLSDGSREIIATIDEPINLYFFFSENSSRDLTGLRAYAKQVQDLLREYELAADGKINLQIIDPAPFSEDEDRAGEFGLQSVPVSTSGEELYFGLAATNALDDQLSIAFFQPDKEAFLEYEVSKLVQSLVTPKKPIVGLLSSIKVQQDINMQTFQTTPAWMVIDQISQMFEVQTVTAPLTQVPEEIDLLIVIHPQNLAEKTLYEIDQFVMRGGRLLAFVDPLSEQNRPASQNPMMQAPQSSSSELNRLLSAWGVTLREDFVLLDAQTALAVSGGPSGRPVRHLAILGMGPDNFSRDDVTISSLESLNFQSAGILDIDDTVETKIITLISSSAYAKPLESMRMQFINDPTDLQKDFEPTGEIYPVAVRLSGQAPSAFESAIGESNGSDHIATTSELNVIVVADTDFLADQMWVQIQNFFGQRIASPWANNGDFVVNAVDNLVGSAALINVRSRGRFSRPFDVVQDLRREAEASYLESANDLQAELAETERQLSELESTPGNQGLFSLTAEQEEALIRFQQEKLRIRKQLRDVRHQLDKDIETLGSNLKFLNVALIPILLTLMLLMFNYVRSRKGSDHES